MKRTQIGWLTIAIILIVDCLMFYQSSDFNSVKIPIIISLAIILLFFKLTIYVDNEYVRFSFGIGLICGKYRFADIEFCRSISYLPLGFGIRFRPGVILFNVSGTKALELSMKGKNRKIWIGTDCPDELVRSINLKLAENQK